ncbi:MAG: tryptophan synthase subunit beta, partial [Melioribacteraceae bacterium]|nr:tryptophan synthase subunit beta [Melioribacteraceae bacterium]
PEHSFLKDLERVQYDSVTDEEALKATILASKLEGILPALETAHAFAYLDKILPTTSNEEVLVINVSGRGDKDLNTIIEKLGDDFNE